MTDMADHRTYTNRGTPDLDGSRLYVQRPGVTTQAVLLGMTGDRGYMELVLDKAQAYDLMDQIQAIVEPGTSRYTRPGKPTPRTWQRTITRPRTVTERRLVVIDNATLVQEAPEQTSYIGGCALVVGITDDKELRLEWWICGDLARKRLAENPAKFWGDVFIGRSAFATTLPSVLRAYASLIEQPTTTRVIEETVTETVTIPAPTTPGVTGEDFRS